MDISRIMKLIKAGNTMKRINTTTSLTKLGKLLTVIASSAMLISCAGTGTGTGTGSSGYSSKKADIELVDWNLSVPIDRDGNGKADSIREEELASGWTDPRYFYRAKDGGYVFKSPTSGFKTSLNTRYVRVELREMLRRGNKKIKTKGNNKNNWVFDTAPAEAKLAAGGVGGTLTGTLAVNRVSTQGERSKVGRVIFAQIHAKKHEPLRLYYRKLPNNKKGSIYFVHEPRNSDDVKVNVIGSSSKSITDADNPDGIELDEKFSYKITTDGKLITTTIMRSGKPDVVKTIDISESGYDSPKEYMYFKAGAYVQDDSGIEDDYFQLTYYDLVNTHGSY